MYLRHRKKNPTCQKKVTRREVEKEKKDDSNKEKSAMRDCVLGVDRIMEGDADPGNGLKCFVLPRREPTLTSAEHKHGKIKHSKVTGLPCGP